MIIRKPYAFLIKNFKKIHIFLILLAIYVYYKTTQTYSFLNEFIKLASYDSFNEPITKYVSFTSIFFLLILISLSVSLGLLLRHKKKPWKLYLLPTITYFVILISFLMVKSYFNGYTGVESTASMRAFRDTLFLTQFIQFGIFLLYIVRIFGIDLNKFNFKSDQEFLELEQSDKEELEININIDKDAFKRTYKRLLRNLNYIYQEHKLLCRVIILIFLLIMGKNTYSYVKTHGTVYEGGSFVTDGYSIKINNSYYSDKAYNGKQISSKSAFVVVDMTIKNLADDRKVNLNRFHIMNGVNNYTTTYKTYETEFKDLGKAFSTLELKKDREQQLIVIFKVDKKLPKNRFVLYYQEFENSSSDHLRKIKVNIEDLSEIKENEELNLEDKLKFNLQGVDEEIIIQSYDITDEVSYTNRICNISKCNGNYSTVQAAEGYKILTLKFGSINFEGTDFITFTKEYAKLIYKNANGKDVKIDVVNALRQGFYGKQIYLKIPNEVATSQSIKLEYIIRNNKYVYKIF